jgi:mono/diheme cytochrome c family protein
MWMLHLGLAVALLTAGPASVLAQATEDLPGDPVAGRTLAEEVCSACHALPGWEPAVAAPGALPFEDLAADPAVTGMALHAFLLGPHPVMPNIVLSEEELDNVIAYILSLKPG